MRVAIFINTYKPVKNGVVISTVLIREGLMSLGHQVDVFTAWFPGAPKEEGVHRFPAIKVPGVDFALPLYDPTGLSLRPKLRGYDVVLLEHPFLLGELGLKLAKSLNLPVAFTFHTQYRQYVHYVPLLPRALKLSLLERHMRRFLKQVDAIIVPSRTFAEEVRSYGALSDKVVHIPNPVDLSRFKPPSVSERRELRLKYGLPPEAKVIGFIGRLAPEKNLLELLEVFRRVNDLIEDVWLVFVGGGPIRDQLQRRAEALGLSNVKLIGPLEPEVVPEAHKILDLFVTCSLSEVKPLAYLEALATGVPIIAYDAHGASDTIEHGLNGLLIPPGDREAMASAIVKLLRDEDEISRMGREALRSAETYSLDVVARRYEELLRELIMRSE